MKYHNSPQGPAPCRATKRACPIGGEHYPSLEEAAKAFEKEAAGGAELAGKKRAPARAAVKSKIEGLNGWSYYGCEVPGHVVEAFRGEWVNHVGVEKAKELEANRAGRVSGSSYHMTVLTPRELRSIKKTGTFTKPPEAATDIELVGVGTISNETNTAWYVVCRSPKADEWRSSQGLGPKDFHITLGFEPKDVYDKFKGEETLI